MTLFASTFAWLTTTIDFVSVAPGAKNGTAEVAQRGGRWILKSPSSFSLVTSQSGMRVLTASLDGKPTLISGTVFPIDGDLELRVDELRVGSSADDAQYATVTATFEHLASACSYRHEDGAARSPSQPLLFPEVDGAPRMEAMLRSGENSITLVAPEPVPLESFEAQLAVFQAMLTFSADLPCGQLTLIATERSGQTVNVFGRDKYAPFERPTRKPGEYSLRFAADWIQHAIDRWWAAYSEWKPVLQILAGLRYQPGYIEADVILSSAAIESAVSHLKGAPRRTMFRSKMEQLILRFDDDVWLKARLSTKEWTEQITKARNTIAHAGSGDIWENSFLLSSILDANWIVLTLVILKYLGVPDPAIDRAAERLGIRYKALNHGVEIFT